MKVYFDVHGALTVEGEDATEWLALRTWTARWSGNAGPLIVKWKTERMTQQIGDEKPWPAIETDSRQLFRCMTETPNVEFSGGAPLHGAASAGTQGYASGGGKDEA